MGSTAQEEMRQFWDRNERSGRPLSPHVTIYRWSLPMAMSITHRATGVALSLGIWVLSQVSLLLSPVPSGISVLSQAWDLGKGLKLPQVTQSGVLVLALTLLSSAALALL
ncbi:hypothetical protein HGM15179_018853 [Zosterops borbonicus]|uniref:Succinate dehydrogenase cytochrome b560 subunit, mitochondrial n=1 Tax=Zosterops borbonicus TaxID=364589 RepID=A0A8K1D9S8_9PASS|nr:hypothetical protein HGM15179_018853 [Zosterops borbonicus]